MRVFVNEQPVDLQHGATVREAVTAFDADLGARVGAGVQVTDGRGIAVDGGVVLEAGSILRAFQSARRVADAES